MRHLDRPRPSPPPSSLSASGEQRLRAQGSPRDSRRADLSQILPEGAGRALQRSQARRGGIPTAVLHPGLRGTPPLPQVPSPALPPTLLQRKWKSMPPGESRAAREGAQHFRHFLTFCVYLEEQRSTHRTIQLPAPPPGSQPRTAFQPRGHRSRPGTGCPAPPSPASPRAPHPCPSGWRASVPRLTADHAATEGSVAAQQSGAQQQRDHAAHRGPAAAAAGVAQSEGGRSPVSNP